MEETSAKNICFFNTLKFWGGGEKFYLQYGLGIMNKGHHVIMVCDRGGKISQKASAHGMKQVHLSVSSLSVLNLFKIIKLVRFFKREKIDAVLFSTSQDLKIGSLSAKLAGVPTICFRRGLAVPVKNRWTNRIIYKHFLTHILANSQETKRTILKHLSDHIPADKIRVIYNGIEISESERGLHPIAKIEQYKRGIVLGNAGRLTKQKGQQHLIDIATKLKKRGLEFSLFIAGTGEMSEELEGLIRENDLSNEVFLLGFVEDMEAFMKSLDIFLLTSEWEGFGYVLAEAMIQSKPIVAFDITSNPELVAEGESGFLVPFSDLDLFTDRICTLMQDRELREKFGAEGKKRIFDKFNIEDRIEEFEIYLLGEA